MPVNSPSPPEEEREKPTVPLPRSHFLRHDEWGAIFPRQQMVGLALAEELLAFRIHVQELAERRGGFREIDIVRRKVLLHPAEHFGHVLIALHRVANFLRRMRLAKPIGDVGGMAKRARKM